MLKTITVPTIEKLLDSRIDNSPFFKRFNRTEMSLDVYNDAKIWMVGLDRPEAAEGMNLDAAWIDEARLIPKFQEALDSVIRRLRGSGKSHPIDEYVPESPLGLWVTTTPDAPGSDMHKFFEHPQHRDPEAKIYRMTVMDNTYLPQSYIEAVKRAHSGGLYKRFVEGAFADVIAGSFDFDYAVHVQEFIQPDIRRMVYGVDFGWTNPSAIIAIAFDGDDRAFVVEEIHESRLSEEAIINQCVELKTKWGEGTFWCDSSEPRTITQLTRVGLSARGNNSKRDDGIRELGSRFKDAGDGRRRLYISPSCVNTIEELQMYNPEKKERDHAVDALRYGIMGAKGTSGVIQVESGWRPRGKRRR